MIGKELIHGAVVLGKYVPEVFDAHRVNAELIEFIARLGIEAYERTSPRTSSGKIELINNELLIDPNHNSEVRLPKSHTDNYNQGWHHVWQGGGNDYALALWSTVSPTQISHPKHTHECMIQAELFDVVMILNHLTLHRIPPDYNPDRWFFRQYVHWPEPVAEPVPKSVIRQRPDGVVELPYET